MLLIHMTKLWAFSNMAAVGPFAVSHNLGAAFFMIVLPKMALPIFGKTVPIANHWFT